MRSIFAGKHIHRLDHVRMTTDDSIDTHITQLLCDFTLPGSFCHLIFDSPVRIYDDEFCAILSHSLDLLFDLLVKTLPVVGIE